MNIERRQHHREFLPHVMQDPVDTLFIKFMHSLILDVAAHHSDNMDEQHTPPGQNTNSRLCSVTPNPAHSLSKLLSQSPAVAAPHTECKTQSHDSADDSLEACDRRNVGSVTYPDTQRSVSRSPVSKKAKSIPMISQTPTSSDVSVDYGACAPNTQTSIDYGAPLDDPVQPGSDGSVDYGAEVSNEQPSIDYGAVVEERKSASVLSPSLAVSQKSVDYGATEPVIHAVLAATDKAPLYSDMSVDYGKVSPAAKATTVYRVSGEKSVSLVPEAEGVAPVSKLKVTKRRKRKRRRERERRSLFVQAEDGIRDSDM